MANTFATGKHGEVRLNGTRYRTESWSLSTTIDSDTVQHDNDWMGDTSPYTAYQTLTVTFRGEQPGIYGDIFGDNYLPIPKEEQNYTVITPEQTHEGSHLVPNSRNVDTDTESVITDEFEFRVDRPAWTSGGNGRRLPEIGPAAVQS